MSLPVTQNETAPSHRNDANDVYLVSDLHLADGRTAPFGKFAHGENFFWDAAFARFLESTSAGTDGRSQTLIINGDFLDFLRVDRIPSKTDSTDAPRVQRWREFLEAINHPAAHEDLCAADKSEIKYGFKTNDFKSVWKLFLIADGHKEFFESLGKFVMHGNNRLIIIKGNHDLELYWEAVRQALVFVVAGRDEKACLVVNDRIIFCQQSIVVNDQLYAEHGHRFEAITWAEPETLQDTPTELLLSVGSLFNRYVINKLEELEPLFDNIVPSTDVLKAVFLHYPAKLWKIVFTHFVGAWRIIRKRHFRFAAKMVGKILTIGLPLLVFAVLLIIFYLRLQSQVTDSVMKWVVNVIASGLGALAVGWLQKTIMGSGSSPSLAEDAAAILRQNPSLTLVTFGHTHGSEMTLYPGSDCWYVNSGTWIPILELKTNRVEDINTFCVLRMLNQDGSLRREPLLRWNDNMRELERLIWFDKGK